MLEQMISSYMSTFQPAYFFSWQGGEPTLMGVEFFQKVLEFQKKYGRRGAIVSNGLQTNATLIDNRLASLLSKYRFLVGVSIDGPPEIHNQFRRHISGRGSHSDVIRGIECLKRHSVEFNVLILVTSANVHQGKEVYRYLCNLNISHHQYIPCVEFNKKGQLLPFAISGEQWGVFLCSIFDEWIRGDIRNVSIRDFDAVLGHLIDWQYGTCRQAGSCDGYFLVEYNGDVYPCDFFVELQKKLGNIVENTWDELENSARYRSFVAQKSSWNIHCVRCPYLRYCSGDCLKYRFYKNTNPKNISWLCRGWKTFYRHTLSTFEKIALTIINERQTALPSHQRRYSEKLPRIQLRRNDPCFCGSGKKFKHCHGGRKGRIEKE